MCFSSLLSNTSGANTPGGSGDPRSGMGSSFSQSLRPGMMRSGAMSPTVVGSGFAYTYQRSGSSTPSIPTPPGGYQQDPFATPPGMH
eukprot:g4559.t1